MSSKARRPAPKPPAKPAAPAENPLPSRILLLVTGALLAARVSAASMVGWGDSEALYASYAAHPQPAYLDHPGLIGSFASAIGGGHVPIPTRAHVFSSAIATIVPFFIVAIAQLAGAKRIHAIIAALFVAVVPEISIGLFAMTPDLLLAPTWLAVIGLTIAGFQRKNGIAFLVAGLLAGVAVAIKASGILLFGALLFVYFRAPVERRKIWPWAGLSAGSVVFAPIIAYEAKSGFPMLRHRFIETQTGAGIALKNIGAVFGGQLLYLSPVIAVLAVIVARDLIRHRNDDDASKVLFATFAIPLLPLALLSIWSPVAEPHWLAPPLLALPIHAARRATLVKPRLGMIALGVGALFSALVYLWVLIPDMSKLRPESVDAKGDITNELFGWPSAVQSIKNAQLSQATPSDPSGRSVILVGPHWTICAQLQAAFPEAKVGCATPVPDDFDGWVPRDEWKTADVVLWVTDNRFANDGSAELPLLTRISQSKVRTMRAGRPARVFELYLYARRAQAAL